MKNIYYPVAHRDPKHIASFKTRYEDFDDSVIPEIFQKALGLDVNSWTPTESWGTAHVIYFVKTNNHDHELVFRANTGFGEPETAMLIEKLVTEKVLSQGLPSNRILYVDISRNDYAFDFQIEEKLGGSDPEVNFTDSQADYDRLSWELGQYIARLSDIDVEGYGLFDAQHASQGKLAGLHNTFYDYLTVRLDEDLRHLVDGNQINIQLANQITKVLEDHQSLINSAPSKLVHHDLADHNLRYEKGHLLAVFDWETAIAGDPALDLASCPTWKTLYPREIKLIEGYSSIKPLPNNFTEKKQIYVLRTILWKMRFRIQMNILQPWHHLQFQESLDPFKLKIS